MKVKRHGVRLSYTLCLGGLSFFLFILLTITGIFLMFYYRPTSPQAYLDIQALATDVAFGQLVRNMHRWGAHLMVLTVFLHMARVFYHGAYKPPREFNWVVGIILLLLTLLLSFTGYLLPWDQLALWAVTVGTNMAAYAPVIGDQVTFTLDRRRPDHPGHVAALVRVTRLVPPIHHRRSSWPSTSGGCAKTAASRDRSKETAWQTSQNTFFGDLPRRGPRPKAAAWKRCWPRRRASRLPPRPNRRQLPPPRRPPLGRRRRATAGISPPNPRQREYRYRSWSAPCWPGPRRTERPFRRPLELPLRPASVLPPRRLPPLRRRKAAPAIPEGVRTQRLLTVVKAGAIQQVKTEPTDKVSIWPHLLGDRVRRAPGDHGPAHAVSVFVDAPLLEFANFNEQPNPSKAPWYFLGLQELLSYFDPQVAGVIIPGLGLAGLAIIPYVDRNPSVRPSDRKLAIMIFTFFLLAAAVLTIYGSFFRGPGFNFTFPWVDGIFFDDLKSLLD